MVGFCRRWGDRAWAQPRVRNFAACCIIVFCAYLALYAASTSLPGLLQSLFGYDALSAGLVMSPAGIAAVVAMPIVGRLLGLGTDARWLIAAGLRALLKPRRFRSRRRICHPNRRLPSPASSQCNMTDLRGPVGRRHDRKNSHGRPCRDGALRLSPR